MRIGDIVSWSRTFHDEDVRAFSRLSGDTGRQHVLPDDAGRLTVQGLLTVMTGGSNGVILPAEPAESADVGRVDRRR